jgi:DNA repair protein RAD5
MLDHANVNFSSSPLHQLLTLLKLKASNKVAHLLICFVSFQNVLVIVFPKCLYAYHVQDDFSLGDLSTRKLQRILRVRKSSCCFYYGYQLFSTRPFAVAFNCVLQ